MSDFYEKTKGKWTGILDHYGIDTSGQHGPCPICGGKDRWRYDDMHGDGDWICGQCGAGKGMQLAMQVTGQDFRNAAQEIDRLLGAIPETPARPRKDPLHYLRKIQSQLIPAVESPDVTAYLGSRKLPLSPMLKAHPCMPYFEDRVKVGEYPAMVAKAVDIDGNPVTLHITYLKDGRKAPVRDPKKTLPPVKPYPGSAIRLHPYSDTLAVAEGIETALACRRRDGYPTWSTICALGMERFVIPASVRTLVIYGDHDESYTGHAAAYALAKRAKTQKIPVPCVHVCIPEKKGDWADDDV